METAEAEAEAEASPQMLGIRLEEVLRVRRTDQAWACLWVAKKAAKLAVCLALRCAAGQAPPPALARAE